MPNESIPFYLDLWNWLKDNDLPNWIIFAFTAIVWPLVIFIWNKRKFNNISGLDVSLAKASIQINGNPHDAVDIKFLNNTGSVVYISTVRIKRCSKLFVVPSAASRDIAENAHDLSFMNPNGDYVLRQFTLHTDQSVKTSIAVAQQLNDTFYRYNQSLWRRILRLRKYFVLEYTAMVGNKKYVVKTIY